MEKVILDAINHIKNISKRKLSLDNILQKNNKTSATNLDTEALTSNLKKMIFKGLIDQNYRVLNKEILQTNIEPSPDKVSFTINDSTEDKTKKKDFYETSSLIGAQDTPIAQAKLDLDNHNKINSPTTNASPDVSLTFTGTQDTPVIKSSISCERRSTCYGTNSIHFGACLLWNKLPKALKESQSLSEFKYKIKTIGKIDCSCKICRSQ